MTDDNLRTAFESWALNTPPDERTNWEVFQAGARAAAQSPAEGALTDDRIEALVYEQCPTFDDAHEGPSMDDVLAIVRAALSASKAQPKGTAPRWCDQRDTPSDCHQEACKDGCQLLAPATGRVVDVLQVMSANAVTPLVSASPAPAQALRKIVAITSRSPGMNERELGLSMGRIQEICEAELATPAPEGAQELPPLPATDYRLFYEDEGDEDHGDEGYQEVLDEPGYTAKEMRDYARAAIRAALAAPAPQAAPLAWLMTADDDGSADWVERGAAQPAPVAGFRAVPLGPLAAPQAPAWQPIETAPKDGREMFVVRAFGIDPTGRATTGGYTSDAYAVFRGANGRLVRWPHIWPPTHWMPLPAAPQTKEPTNGR